MVQSPPLCCSIVPGPLLAPASSTHCLPAHWPLRPPHTARQATGPCVLRTLPASPLGPSVPPRPLRALTPGPLHAFSVDSEPLAPAGCSSSELPPSSAGAAAPALGSHSPWPRSDVTLTFDWILSCPHSPWMRAGPTSLPVRAVLSSPRAQPSTEQVPRKRCVGDEWESRGSCLPTPRPVLAPQQCLVNQRET